VLKQVLFFVLVAFTGVRLVDVIYLMADGQTNLPGAVIGVTTAMVAYGVFLIAKKLIFNIRVKELMAFYMAWAAAIVFNLSFLRISRYPFALSLPEFIAVGTILDLIVIACVVYYGTKQMRRTSFPVLTMRERTDP
jgi:hypothetical protein